MGKKIRIDTNQRITNCITLTAFRFINSFSTFFFCILSGVGIWFLKGEKKTGYYRKLHNGAFTRIDNLIETILEIIEVNLCKS